MPRTEVYFYQEPDGTVPVLHWIDQLRQTDKRAFKKCFALINLLKQLGRELRRPQADYLRDGVFELRTRVGRVNYRILYGFVGKDAAILTNGLSKERTIPPREIEAAVQRIQAYNSDPESHCFKLEKD